MKQDSKFFEWSTAMRKVLSSFIRRDNLLGDSLKMYQIGRLYQDNYMIKLSETLLELIEDVDDVLEGRRFMRKPITIPSKYIKGLDYPAAEKMVADAIPWMNKDQEKIIINNLKKAGYPRPDKLTKKFLQDLVTYPVYEFFIQIDKGVLFDKVVSKIPLPKAAGLKKPKFDVALLAFHSKSGYGLSFSADITTTGGEVEATLFLDHWFLKDIIDTWVKPVISNIKEEGGTPVETARHYAKKIDDEIQLRTKSMTNLSLVNAVKPEVISENENIILNITYILQYRCKSADVEYRKKEITDFLKAASARLGSASEVTKTAIRAAKGYQRVTAQKSLTDLWEKGRDVFYSVKVSFLIGEENKFETLLKKTIDVAIDVSTLLGVSGEERGWTDDDEIEWGYEEEDTDDSDISEDELDDSGELIEEDI